VQFILLDGPRDLISKRMLGRKGHFKKGQNIVFLHTGGSVALYGYMHAFQDALKA